MPTARFVRFLPIVAVVAAATGCLDRRFVVETNAPGAQVFVNGRPIGPSPADTGWEYPGRYEFRVVAPGYDAAMRLLGGTDALVLDLRNNGGGEPTSVSYLLSHFFAEGDERHLNDIYDRPTNTTREYRTMPIGAPRFLRPIAVLTSKATASGGEECAYDLQTQQRATLYGETTMGAANPGAFPPSHAATFGLTP